jgi:hypothetical protein
MKRVAAAFFLFCILISHSGMTISVHWCGNSLTHVSFYSIDSYLCSCKQMERLMKPDCCKDGTGIFQSKDDLTNDGHVNFTVPDIGHLFAFVESFDQDVLFVSDYILVRYYYPPKFKPKVPLYMQSGTFII